MLKVEHYARIRLAHRDGVSIRRIARTYCYSRHKIRQVLNESEPQPYKLSAPRLGRILTDDLKRAVAGPESPVLETDPSVAVGDGALGFWAALRMVFPRTREQRCWVRKTPTYSEKGFE